MERPRWPFGQKIVQPTPKTESQLSPSPVAQVNSDFEQRMEKGEYLGILETYGVKWSLEKVARDTLQNFYDVNNTLDGVTTKVTTQQIENKNVYVVRVEGNGEYDFRELVHLGGTSKDKNEQSAGGFGEGAKIAALVLLRDYNFQEVKYGSKGWELTFYLDKAPEGSYGKDARGLWAKLSKVPEREGSYTEFKTTTTSPEDAKSFVKARELFFSSENADFSGPGYVTEDGFGVKLIGPKVKGHLYDAGQRRHFDNEEKGWDTVEGINVWTHQKVFGSDRDRGVISRTNLEQKVLKPLIEGIPYDNCGELIMQMEDYWPSKDRWGFEVSTKLLDGLIEKLAASDKKLNFDAKYLSKPLFMPSFIVENLEKQGHVMCSSGFEKIGMKSANDRFMEMQDHFRVETNEEENNKIDLLYKSLDLISKLVPEDKAGKLAYKEIWLYSKENEKSIIEGQYNDQFVWLSQERMRESFAKALATYLHEVDHKYGLDYSAEFSYALTDTLEFVIDAMEKSPEEFKKIRSEWEKITAVQTTKLDTELTPV